MIRPLFHTEQNDHVLMKPRTDQAQTENNVYEGAARAFTR